MQNKLLTQRNLFQSIYKAQKGITGLETAIILIAFVVVASVFAYTVLGAGLFSSQKSQEAVFSALDETQGTLQIRGSVIGYNSTLNANNSLGKIDLTIALYGNGKPIDLTPSWTYAAGTLNNSNPSSHKLQVSFSDSNATLADAPWTINWIGKNNSDNLLDPMRAQLSRSGSMITTPMSGRRAPPASSWPVTTWRPIPSLRWNSNPRTAPR